MASPVTLHPVVSAPLFPSLCVCDVRPVSVYTDSSLNRSRGFVVKLPVRLSGEEGRPRFFIALRRERNVFGTEKGVVPPILESGEHRKCLQS